MNHIHFIFYTSESIIIIYNIYIIYIIMNHLYIIYHISLSSNHISYQNHNLIFHNCETVQPPITHTLSPPLTKKTKRAEYEYDMNMRMTGMGLDGGWSKDLWLEVANYVLVICSGIPIWDYRLLSSFFRVTF